MKGELRKKLKESLPEYENKRFAKPTKEHLKPFYKQTDG
jgi:hypothetical protein